MPKVYRLDEGPSPFSPPTDQANLGQSSSLARSESGSRLNATSTFSTMSFEEWFLHTNNKSDKSSGKATGFGSTYSTSAVLGAAGPGTGNNAASSSSRHNKSPPSSLVASNRLGSSGLAAIRSGMHSSGSSHFNKSYSSPGLTPIPTTPGTAMLGNSEGIPSPGKVGSAGGTGTGSGNGRRVWPPRIKSIELPKKVSDTLDVRVHRYRDVVAGTHIPKSDALRFQVADCRLETVVSVLTSVQSPSAGRIRSQQLGRGNSISKNASNSITLSRGNTMANALSINGNYLYVYSTKMNSWRVINSELDWEQAKLVALDANEPLKVMIRNELDGDGDFDGDLDGDHDELEAMDGIGLGISLSVNVPERNPTGVGSTPSSDPQFTDRLSTSRPVSGNPMQSGSKALLSSSLTGSSATAALTAASSDKAVATPTTSRRHTPRSNKSHRSGSSSSRSRSPSLSPSQSPRDAHRSPPSGFGSAPNSRRQSTADQYINSLMAGNTMTPPPLSIAPCFGTKTRATITSIQLQPPVVSPYIHNSFGQSPMFAGGGGGTRLPQILDMEGSTASHNPMDDDHSINSGGHSIHSAHSARSLHSIRSNPSQSAHPPVAGGGSIVSQPQSLTTNSMTLSVPPVNGSNFDASHSRYESSMYESAYGAYGAYGSFEEFNRSSYYQQQEPQAIRQHRHGRRRHEQPRDPRQNLLTMTYSRVIEADPTAPSADKQEALALALEQRLLKTRW
jgi:hypothetical protein